MAKAKATMNIHISKLIDKVEVVIDPSLKKKKRERLEKAYIDSVRELEESISQGILRSVELASRL